MTVIGLLYIAPLKRTRSLEIVTQTTGTRSAAREIHGVGTNSLLLTDTVIGSVGLHEANVKPTVKMARDMKA